MAAPEPVKSRNRHFSDIEHRPFDPQCDRNLYFDLDDLPDNIPMMRFSDDFRGKGDVKIPVFIGGPLKILAFLIEKAPLSPRNNFIDYLEYSVVYEPTPEHPDCLVCQLVRYLLTGCYCIQDMLRRFYYLEPIIIFEVMREIWSRFLTKPLVISGPHLHYAMQYQYTNLPFVTEFLEPMDLERTREVPCYNVLRTASLEMTNGFMYFLRKDIGCGGMRSRVACCIFSHLMRMLRIYIKSVMPEYLGESESFRMFDVIRVGFIQSIEAFVRLARAIGCVVADIDPRTMPNEASAPPGYHKASNACYRAMIQRVLENIFVMNNIDVFNLSIPTEDLYIHFCECRQDPTKCLCRFVRKLENNEC